jgi:hypothetical protein
MTIILIKLTLADQDEAQFGENWRGTGENHCCSFIKFNYLMKLQETERKTHQISSSSNLFDEAAGS